MAITASTLASRRANFLSGTRFAADAALNAELGEDNAARLRTVLGEQLIAAGFKRDSAGIGEATYRIIGQLSAAERLSALSSGSLPARVAGLVSEESTRLAATAPRPVNIYSAEATPTTGSDIHRPRGPGMPMVDGMQDRSSARYTELRETSRPEYVQARELARSLGMTWAMNNYELMQLGPQAVRAFAAVNIGGRGYNHLRTAGFTAAETVTVAKYFKHIGVQDGDKVARELHLGIDKLAGDGADATARLQRINQHLKAIMERPEDRSPEAQERRQRAHEGLREIAGNNPRRQEGLREIEGALRLQRTNELGATANAQTDQTKARADADAFNQPTPAAKVEAKPEPAATTAPQVAAKPNPPRPTA